MLSHGTTYSFIFVVGRMVNEPMDSTPTDDGGQPHGASMSSGGAATHELRKSTCK
jgi:hypothetical protein